MEKEQKTGYRYPIEKPGDIKLLVLYVVEQARSVCKKDKISRQWLSDFIVENVSVHPFLLPCAIGELHDDGYLFASVSEREDMLTITLKGVESIGFFFTNLPLSVRESVDKALIESLLEKTEKDSVVAEYVKFEPEVHMATLRLFDRDEPQLYLNIAMPEKQTAIDLSHAMKDHAPLLYRRVMEACNEILELHYKDEKEE